MIKNNNDKLTWTSDLRVAYEVATGTPARETPFYFNDKHLTCRRIKFHLWDKNLQTLTDETLNQIQEAIQARRPNHTVQVAPWGTWGEVVIYYRMKNAHYMDHDIK